MSRDYEYIETLTLDILLVYVFFRLFQCTSRFALYLYSPIIFMHVYVYIIYKLDILQMLVSQFFHKQDFTVK